MTTATLFTFNQLNKEAQDRVLVDAKNQNVFHPEAYKGMFFYANGKRYSH